ncbi:MAG: hypothetical protein KHY88_08235 [Erysipelotrichaceae bacterium]|nr:hypothetical protein [Erysipelotrichaceae bacterium]
MTKRTIFKKDFLIAGISRDDELIVPKGDDIIHANDHVIVVTKNHIIKNLKDILN